ncbi:MAG: hypothetical protein K8I29_03650 [Alphaproteobacteria bacterium]|uniref:Uncharacterized protein n=1 Tax=Candidatus Nitrobium versatile TaxID=2884831 RepID=A0A953J2Z8_9BACT|nr:hypothetical protein [Candidatus Nitrobium versatile]
MVNRHNYASRMELKKQTMLSTGLLSNRFPEVSGIVIQMTYYQKGSNPVLMVRTVNILPSSYAYFKMDCMIKGCEGGGFDLTSIVADMVKDHKKAKKGTLVCSGESDILDSAHASIAYEIAIHYNS